MTYPESWRRTVLSEIITLQRGFDLPHAQRQPGRFPVLSSGEQQGQHNDFRVKGPGFVVGRATNLGVPTWSEEDFWPLNTTLFVADFKGNNPRYLFRLFQRLDLSGFNSGSVQPMLNRNYISQVPVVIPPLDEQQAIAEVLGALDDKIAANDKAVFISRELRNALVRTAINPNERWQIGEKAEFVGRGRAPSYVDDPSAQWVINQKCIREGTVELTDARKTARRQEGERALTFGDVLVNSTGAGTLGRVGIWTVDSDATVDSHVTIIRFSTTQTPFCNAELVRLAEAAITALGEGSTGQTELGLGLLRELMLPETFPELARVTETKLFAMHRQEKALRNESHTLAQFRDTLLPALVDGRLRVRDAIERAEEVL